jgi:SNF2 family DNA or RNA helicase
MFKRSDFHNYQEEAYKIILTKKKCGLFLDMGLGKTATTLTAAADMLDNFLINKVLIIAPLRVANSVWKQEALKWEHLQHLNIKICTGSEKQRLEAIKSNADIYIINRENIHWLIQKCQWIWDMTIVDESSSFKNSRSQRFKALKKMTKYMKSLVLLSGTPTPNGEMDLWSQLYLIDNGERLGRTITNFRQRFFTSDYMGYSYKIIPGASDKIKELIKDVCVTMSADDYLDLPDQISLIESVEFPDKVKEQYKELEKNFLLTLGKIDIASPSQAALGNKLLQMCNGAIYDNSGNSHEIHNIKIDVLKEIVEENPGENFLVAYNYKSDLEKILKAFPKAVLIGKGTKEQDDWNAGKIKMLVTHPASTGHGLNLQFGGNILVWFGLNWSLELYQQFNKRLHRQGQKNLVRIIHIVAKGGLDENVMLALNNKAKTQQELIDFLKFKLLSQNNTINKSDLIKC